MPDLLALAALPSAVAAAPPDGVLAQVDGLVERTWTVADGIWQVLAARAERAPTTTVLLAAAVALAAVLVRPVWRWSRNVVTVAHEGAHAVVALVCGRRLAGIRLHSDTSGVTVSAGRPSGPGMVATAAAGYVGPSLLGLAAAAAVSAGLTAATLWGVVTLLALMLLQIRNVFGGLVLLVVGAVVLVVSWWAPETVQQVFALALAWFLLLAGPRPVWELQAKRRRGAAPESDADQLAHLTGVPGSAWVVGFAAVSVAAAFMGALWLLGADGWPWPA